MPTSRRALPRPLLALFALLVAVAPVASYAHALEHTHLPVGAAAGHGDAGPGAPRDGGAPPEPSACEVFGAHAPLGGAAAAAGCVPPAPDLPDWQVSRSEASHLPDVILPYQGRAPPGT